MGTMFSPMLFSLISLLFFIFIFPLIGFFSVVLQIYRVLNLIFFMIFGCASQPKAVPSCGLAPRMTIVSTLEGLTPSQTKLNTTTKSRQSSSLTLKLYLDTEKLRERKERIQKDKGSIIWITKREGRDLEERDLEGKYRQTLIRIQSLLKWKDFERKHNFLSFSFPSLLNMHSPSLPLPFRPLPFPSFPLISLLICYPNIVLTHYNQ